MTSFSNPRALLSGLLFLLLYLQGHPAAAIQPRILADTNRDGLVDNLDAENKYLWTQSRGAIFLPNIGDAYGRCPTTDLLRHPLSNEELSHCNDASGSLMLTPEYAAPLRTISMPNVSDTAWGRVYATPDPAYHRVRVFIHHGLDHLDSSQWTLIDQDFSINSTQLREGLTLGVDAREFVVDSSVWDGYANIHFEVQDGNTTGTDFVAMRVAPVLLHHHLQQPEVVLSTVGDSSTPHQAGFVQSLNNSLSGTHPTVPLILINQGDDVWTQDFFEPAYASMPGKDGPVSIRVLLRSAQSTRAAGRQVFEQLRGRGIGAYQPGPGSGFGFEEINSGGNIETIPPYVSKSGVSYLSGRVITGKHFSKLPAISMLDFLHSQGNQTPLLLETGWLLVGHVDEMVQFLPFDNHLGFTIAIADTTSALAILKGGKDRGHGSTTIFTYDGDLTPDPAAVFLDPTVFNMTIDELLSDAKFLEANSYAQKHIDINLELLLQEINLPLDQVLKVPTLFQDFTIDIPRSPDGLPPRATGPLPGEKKLKAFYPQAINGLVLGKDYIAPRAWGPVIDGHDIMELAIAKVYAKVNMTVHFIDDFMSHHVKGGEIHCGTNTFRQTDMPWWEI